VATTNNATDDPVVSAAETLGCSVFRGDEYDVLGRFHSAALSHDLDLIVRATSDCPLIDGHLVRQGVDLWLSHGRSDLYVSNALTRTYPRGLDFEVFSFELLQRAHTKATEPHEREHVTPYMYTGADPTITSAQLTRTADGAEQLRLTLDTPDDYELLQVLFEKHAAATLDAEALIHLLRQHPELAALNRHVQQKGL